MPGFFHQLFQRRIAGLFETSDFDMAHSLSFAYQDMLRIRQMGAKEKTDIYTPALVLRKLRQKYDKIDSQRSRNALCISKQNAIKPAQHEERAVSMQFCVKDMTKEDAHLIAAWHYEAPYDFYDMDRDPDDLAELLDPHSWKESYFSVHNERDELIGFFAYKRVNEKRVEIGLGLRPNLTGKGLGRAFVHAGVAFAQTHFSVSQVSLYVATFNHRAIRVYEQSGFIPLGTHMRQTNGGEYEFLQMIQHLS